MESQCICDGCFSTLPRTTQVRTNFMWQPITAQDMPFGTFIKAFAKTVFYLQRHCTGPGSVLTSIEGVSKFSENASLFAAV